MTADTPKGLNQLLARYDETPRSLALGLREIVLQELASCHEYIFQMRSKVVLLYGASERVIGDGICSIGVFRRHVTLTFVEGVDLEDPRQLLRGAGKTMRHVRVSTSDDLARRDLRKFLRQARALARLPTRRGRASRRVITRVKGRSAAKSTFGATFRPQGRHSGSS